MCNPDNYIEFEKRECCLGLEMAENYSLPTRMFFCKVIATRALHTHKYVNQTTATINNKQEHVKFWLSANRTYIYYPHIDVKLPN
jgi:hypothetical protein